MPAVYKILAGIIALIGNLSLLTTGQLNPVYFAISSLMFIGYWRAIKSLPQLNRYAIAALSVGAFLVFLIDCLFLSRDVIIAVGHLSLLWHTIKSFDIKDPWDPLQVFFMALIQLFLASELTNSMIFGIMFVVFMIALIYAVVYSHFIKEGLETIKGVHRSVMIITILILFCTVVFFVSLPRLKGGLWGRGYHKEIKTGFTEEVNIGSLNEIKTDSTIVMRATINPVPSKVFYWRGITYEIYKGGQWFDLDNTLKVLTSKNTKFNIGSSSGQLYCQDIILEPLNTELVFTLKGIKKIRAPSKKIKVSQDGALYIPNSKGKRFRYKVFSTLEPDRTAPVQTLHLQVPDELVRLKRLAKRIVSENMSSTDKAHRILQYLKNNYSYSLRFNYVKGFDPVEYFLFYQKKGYCEHFATAMVLLLRAAGVPARLVTGYAAGQYNRYGNYFIIRQKDAHTWVEAWINGQWQEFDPTPTYNEKTPSGFLLLVDYLKMKWDRYVVGFSSRDQKTILNLLRLPMERIYIKHNIKNLKFPIWVLYFIFLIPIFYVVRYISFMLRHPPWLRRYLNLKSKLNMSDTATPSEVLQKAIRQFPERTSQLEEIINTYLINRFSNKKTKI